MQATADLQVVPLGQGVSVRQEITQAIDLLENYPLVVKTHAAGTNLEGQLQVILDAVAAVHAQLHDSGCVRLLSYIKLETRTDKLPTLEGKRLQR